MHRVNTRPRHPRAIIRSGDGADLCPVTPVHHLDWIADLGLPSTSMRVREGAAGRIIALAGCLAEALHRGEQQHEVQWQFAEYGGKMNAHVDFRRKTSRKACFVHAGQALVLQHNCRHDKAMQPPEALRDLFTCSLQPDPVGRIRTNVMWPPAQCRQTFLLPRDARIERTASDPDQLRIILTDQILAQLLAQSARAAGD